MTLNINGEMKINLNSNHTYPSIADHTPCFESTRWATLCLSTGQTRIERVVSKVLLKQMKMDRMFY